MRYKKVIIGGTFDRFHIGHEYFLDKAFSLGEEVLIGLTTNVLLKKIVTSNSVWPYKKRKKKIEEFAKKYGKKFEIFPIDNRFGPSVDIEDLDAIIATKETESNCKKINKIRIKKGLKPLKIILIPYLYSEDCRIISSTRIRKDEIDKEGRILIDYVITDKLRNVLKKPSGKIFEGKNTETTKKLISYIKKRRIKNVISVGDEVSYDLIKNGFIPKNVIIDGKVKRKPVDYKDFILEHYDNKFSLNNLPGMISIESWSIIKEALGSKSAVVVNGEEDLLGFPAVLIADNNSVLIRGQPDKGKVLVETNEMEKEKLRMKLTEFNITPRKPSL
jgi:pantetheine-phosphate adenylyltransferase